MKFAVRAAVLCNLQSERQCFAILAKRHCNANPFARQEIIRDIEGLSHKLNMLANLLEAIDQQGTLAGASTCLLACAVQCVRAGVKLGDKVADTIIGRDIKHCLLAMDMDELSDTLRFTRALGLTSISEFVSVDLYSTTGAAVRQQDFFLKETLTELLNFEAPKTHLKDDVGSFLKSLKAKGIASASTGAAMDALATLISSQEGDLSEQADASITAAFQVLDADGAFGCLLSGTARGKELADKARAVQRQRLADERCAGQLAELDRLVAAAQSRQKVRHRSGCCMVSLHECARHLAPCAESLASLKAMASQNFMKKHNGKIAAASGRIDSCLATLFEAQQKQHWGTLAEIVAYCSKAVTTCTSEGSDDTIAEALASPQLKASLTAVEDTFGKIFAATSLDTIAASVSQAKAVHMHLSKLFEAIRARKFDDIEFFNQDLAVALEVLASSTEVHNDHSAQYKQAVDGIRSFCSSQAVGLLNGICGKFEEAVKEIIAIVKDKSPRRLSFAAPRNLSVQACDEAWGGRWGEGAQCLAESCWV